MTTNGWKARRWRLSLRLRGLLLLILAIGLWLGWRVHLVRVRREAIGTLRKEYPGIVEFDWEMDDGVRPQDIWPWGIGWLRQAIGEDYFQEVAKVDLIFPIDVSTEPKLALKEIERLVASLAAFPRRRHLYLDGRLMTDHTMETIGSLRDLEVLRIAAGSPVIERGLVYLEGLRKLEVLDLNDAGITDHALAHVAGLEHLEWLSLNDNPITDTGLSHLKGLKALWYLAIEGTGVSDAGLNELRGLTHLEELRVSGSAITDKGLTRFRAEMPNLEFVR